MLGKKLGKSPGGIVKKESIHYMNPPRQGGQGFLASFQRPRLLFLVFSTMKYLKRQPVEILLTLPVMNTRQKLSGRLSFKQSHCRNKARDNTRIAFLIIRLKASPAFIPSGVGRTCGRFPFKRLSFNNPGGFVAYIPIEKYVLL